jgi:hypothetical protein
MRRFWGPALAALVLALAPSPAFAVGKTLPAGSTPPPLGKFDVVQGDPFNDLKGLKGHVVQLVFFATW